MDNEFPSRGSFLVRRAGEVELGKIEAGPMHTLAGGLFGTGLFAPGANEQGGLKKALKFLKFSPEEVATLKNLIGTAINIATSIVTIVGIAGTVIDIAKKIGLFGSQEKSVESYLKDIMRRVEDIYNFLLTAERQGYVHQAVVLRSKVDTTRKLAGNTKISRDDEVLRRAEDALTGLIEAIGQMLDLNLGEISFRKETYGGDSQDGWAWLAARGYLSPVGGGLAPGAPGAGPTVWDPGHYIDVLIYALRERLLLVTMLEPVFQSTGYDRQDLVETADAIEAFAQKWRASMLVANPDIQIQDNGVVSNPRYPYASDPANLKSSILVGTADPVSGISSIDTFDGFAMQVQTIPSQVGPYTTVITPDVAAARQAAYAAHLARLQQVIEACGVIELERLGRAYRQAGQRSLHSLLAIPQPPRAVVPSFGRLNVVDTPFGTISSPMLPFAGEPAQLTLGDLAPFSGKPDKVYAAERFLVGTPMSSRFRVIVKGDRTKTLPGYRIVVCKREIALRDFAFGGALPTSFPAEAIVIEHEFETTVWDQVQARHLTNAELNKLVKEPDPFVLVENNRRKGRAKVRIDVTYEPPASDNLATYVGAIEVVVTPIDIEQLPDAFDARLEVYETITDDIPGRTAELPAESVSIAVAPSYLIAGTEFFDDHWKAYVAMLQSVKDLIPKVKVGIESLHEGHPDWQRRISVDVEQQIAWVKQVAVVQPDLVRDVIADLQVPTFLMR